MTTPTYCPPSTKTARERSETLRRRKRNYWKRGNEIHHFCDVDVAIFMRRKSRRDILWAYVSEKKADWPPTKESQERHSSIKLNTAEDYPVPKRKQRKRRAPKTSPDFMSTFDQLDLRPLRLIERPDLSSDDESREGSADVGADAHSDSTVWHEIQEEACLPPSSRTRNRTKMY